MADEIQNLIDANDRTARLEQKQADFSRDMNDFLERLDDFNRRRRAIEALQPDAEFYPHTLKVLRDLQIDPR